MTNDEIEKRIAAAPELLRERLERLHRAGILNDPGLREAILNAAQEIKRDHSGLESNLG